MNRSHISSLSQSRSSYDILRLVALSLVAGGIAFSGFSKPIARPHSSESYTEVTCCADTPAYEKTARHLQPGLLRHQFVLEPWKIFLYDGALLASRSLGSKLDTLYISHTDTTYLCETLQYPDTLMTSGQETYKTLSIVGNVVSYEVSYNSDAGAHPSYGSQYHTIELGFKREDVQLTELFAPQDIFQVLMADTLIRRYLYDKGPKTLDALISNLDGGCDVEFTSMLAAWCIYDIGTDSVIVEFGLTHGCEAGQGNFTTIHVTLPIPVAQHDIFTRARNAGTVSTKIFSSIGQ